MPNGFADHCANSGHSPGTLFAPLPDVPRQYRVGPLKQSIYLLGLTLD